MNNTMMIKGAVFDMDGTLINSLMFWDYFWNKFGIRYLSKEGFRPEERVDIAVRTMIIENTAKFIKSEYSLDADENEIREFIGSGLESFYRTVVTVKEGVFEFLDHLKKEGISMCVASATDMKYVRVALDVLGLAPYFQAVMSCADIGVGKDVPDIYLMARDALGFSENEICVYEDSFVAIETAIAAGFRTVGIYDRYNYNQERLKASSDIYIGIDDKISDLIEKTKLLGE